MLETDRLLFRDHRMIDLEAFCEMEADPIYRAPQPVHPYTEIVRSFREAWMPKKPMCLMATVYKAEGRYIGRCGLYPHRDENDEVVPGEANIAFYIARPYWGQGLATEAGLAFIQHGFEKRNLRRIHGGVNAQNLASISVLEKLGFTLTHTGEGGGTRWHAYELLNPNHI